MVVKLGPAVWGTNIGFEVKRPRNIVGPKAEEVRREWRRLHNDELHNFYPSQQLCKQNFIGQV
jgi:hypothetical protein